ncbi:type II toxin-antitoxin system Phd/YefM family antitoxin [Ornithinimicrobium cryptoxanthini]|uniref:Antitoxin n=1 Tax=Ornithinimicrobium cryptoxanthini TaxID=2934161 RepID=A0ABY4YLJ5_9MICO|nr:type II toxin-antitoxin system prevent-host-death family antitoxin [Ornithinimicrobium cryptoxanthini]USQ77479.1 type II toxin-antitoxin system prevent-host-death family antitoxin [Ornithinimicrobium cryptoxanthini]
MRTISATEASRRFPDMLDAVAAGETVTVTRGGQPIAEISPARHRTGRDLRLALAATSQPDESFETDIAEAVAGLDHAGGDPWAAG